MIELSNTVVTESYVHHAELNVVSLHNEIYLINSWWQIHLNYLKLLSNEFIIVLMPIEFGFVLLSTITALGKECLEISVWHNEHCAAAAAADTTLSSIRFFWTANIHIA